MAAAQASSAPGGGRLRRALGRVAFGLVLLWCVAAATLLTVRHVLVPVVGEFRAPIERVLAAQIGAPVSIGRIEGGWAGWRLRLRMDDVDISDAEGRPALKLRSVDATLAWSSLLRLRPYFHRLDILAPELALRRDAAGRVHVAGVALGAGEDGGDGAGLQWLFAQRQIFIRGARLSWQDELRAAPTLLLEDLSLRLDRRGFATRLALEAQPPAALAGRVRLRAQLRALDGAAFARAGYDLAALGGARGSIYLELEAGELGAWRPWVDYPLPLDGRGALRAWLDADGEGGLALTADLAVAGLRTRLGADLPELEVQRLQGRLGAARDARRWQLSTRGLQLETADGQVLAPTDVVFELARGGAGAAPGAPEPVAAGGQLRANRLDFAVLAALAAQLPLDAGVRARLAAFEPRGQLHALQLSWQGEAAAPARWALAAGFEGMGVRAREGLPGMGGLSGSIEGDSERGRFSLEGAGMHIDLPAVFDPGRLDFDRLRAEGGWSRRDGRLEVALDGAEFENGDAAGSASGRYWPAGRPGIGAGDEPGREASAEAGAEVSAEAGAAVGAEAGRGRGEIDLQASLRRAEATAVWRYLPRVVNARTRAWVQRAVRAATVPEARLRLQGKLADFPFRDDPGQFLVSVRMADAVLDYAPGWPRIEGIAGELRFEGPGMRIAAERGRIYAVELADVAVEIPDLGARPTPVMHIEGQARGPTADFLRFVADSPLAARVGRFTTGIVARGAGELALKLDMPLREMGQTTVTGDFRFAGNSIGLLEALPALEAAAGQLRFSADSLAIPEARARLFGHPLRLQAQTARDGTVRFEASGRAAADAVRAAYDHPLLDALSGDVDWSTTVSVSRQGARVEVSSDLLGLASSLPAPLNKSAGEAWAARFVHTRPVSGAETSFELEVGDVLHAALTHAEGARPALRGGVAIGRATLDAPPASAAGVHVAAVLDRLDVDAWRRAGGAGAGAVPAAGMLSSVSALTLAADALSAFGQTLKAVDLRATADAGGWKARLESDAADGEFDWRHAGNGALAARFRHLRIARGAEAGATADDEGAESSVEEAAADRDPRSLPALDIVAERFALEDRALGRLELFARNRGSVWQLERFVLDNEDGRLGGSGQWRAAGRQRTQLEFTLSSDNMGRLIRRLGYEDVVRGGAAALSGTLAWRGAPTRIDYPTLSGSVKLETGSGQFNKLEPGVGRLLGILSLQSLPRRITLDFRDVFSEGFAFDRISGSIDAASGVLRTEDLEIRGPAARVRLRGTANVVAETQDLDVFVQPTLSESVAIGAAAGLLNPAVGVVTYLAQKMLSDPIEKLFAFEYAITGSWSDPQVAKRGTAEPRVVP